jgi:hypothetical protein
MATATATRPGRKIVLNQTIGGVLEDTSWHYEPGTAIAWDDAEEAQRMVSRGIASFLSDEKFKVLEAAGKTRPMPSRQ